MSSFMLSFAVLSLPFHWKHSRCESREQGSSLAPNASAAWKYTITVVPAKFQHPQQSASGRKDHHCRRQTLPSRGSGVPAKFLAKGSRVTSFQSNIGMRRLLPQYFYVIDVVLSSGTTGGFEAHDEQGGCSNRPHHPHCPAPKRFR